MNRRSILPSGVDLYHHSVQTILKNQHASGAYVASPNYKTYQYCWFRDGSYNGFAMDLAGQHDSAHKFYDWCVDAVIRRESQIELALSGGHLQDLSMDYPSGSPPPTRRSELPSSNLLLHTRYQLDGSIGSEEWANHQLDGFGTLLWAMSEHVKRAGLSALPASWRTAMQLLARYLAALWHLPCFDCWEEDADKIHISTLGAVYGGLKAASSMLGESHYSTVAASIKAYVVEKGVTSSGAFAKHIGSDQVDAALIHLAVPYGMFDVNDVLMIETVRQIELLRVNNGGVHRYRKDTFYGGGEWVLLTAYLGWFYALSGNTKKALELARWIEGSAAKSNGDLPEQISANVYVPEQILDWQQRWGNVACPLLWSHGAYLTLAAHLPPETEFFNLMALGDLPVPSALSASSVFVPDSPTTVHFS